MTVKASDIQKLKNECEYYQTTKKDLYTAWGILIRASELFGIKVERGEVIDSNGFVVRSEVLAKQVMECSKQFECKENELLESIQQLEEKRRKEKVIKFGERKTYVHTLTGKECICTNRYTDSGQLYAVFNNSLAYPVCVKEDENGYKYERVGVFDARKTKNFLVEEKDKTETYINI